MSSKFLHIVKDVLNKKVDIKILERICNLQEKLQYCYDLSEMIDIIYTWLHTHYEIQDFICSLDNLKKNIKDVIVKKGKDFSIDDKFTFYFIVDTKTELNAMISFRAISQENFQHISENYRYIETLFLQVSPILQSGILKKIHLESTSLDTLTHLHNRKYLLKYIDTTLKLSNEKKDNITFFVIGIDRFKAVIDEFDYDIGDKVLIELAKVIHSNIQQKDIVARLVGDEFLVALVHVSKQVIIEKIAQKIIDDFAKTSVIVDEKTDQKLKKTICIGISFYPKDSDDIDQVIKNADAFLYEAKNKGRGNYAIYQKEKEGMVDLF